MEYKKGQHRKDLILLSTGNPTKWYNFYTHTQTPPSVKKFVIRGCLDHKFYLLKTAETRPTVIQSATVVCPVKA